MARKHPNAMAMAAFALLALAFCSRFFFGEVLLPADALYTAQPWKPFAEQQGVGTVHNELIADLVVQNLSWKRFVAESYADGQFPLWNPRLFAGTPFLAAGQYGALYPFGVLFMMMPVEAAYGPFSALHLFLAGALTFWFMRTIGASRAGAFVAGVAFELCGFLTVSFVWPMILSAAVWLPLGLTACELVAKNLERGTWSERGVGLAPGARLIVPMGALAVGLELLAGHLEISFYFLFTLMVYSAFRLSLALYRTRELVATLRAGFGLVTMVAVGFAVAGAQIVPFFELIRENYRIGQVNYGDVAGWALPKQHVLAFLVPDIFGNPTHHSYFDLIQGAVRSVTNSRDAFGNVRDYPFWGIKNYVEGSSYVGVLTLLLAGAALLRVRTKYVAFFGVYLGACLLLAFGTPAYALVWWIPGVDQLHTPFRWMYPGAFCLAALSGLGVTALFREGAGTAAARRLGVLVVGLAAGVFGVLIVSRILIDSTLSLVEQVRRRSTFFDLAFPDNAMAYSYEAARIAGFGLALLIGGVALWLASRRPASAGPLLGGAVALDLFITFFMFNTASNPRLVQFVPPSLAAIKQDTGLYRTVAFNYDDTLRPNTNMLVGISDIRGYDTVILRDYVNYWRMMEEPSGLLYSQINRLADAKSLESPLLDLLNVKYVLTTQNIGLPHFREIYRGEINVYRNERAMDRAFAVGQAIPVADAAAARAEISKPGFDARRSVAIETNGAAGATGTPGAAGRVAVASYESNRVEVRATMDRDGWLVLTDAYFAGWRAAVDGKDVPVVRANGLFRAVALPAGEHMVVFRYVPWSFQIGGYLSLLGLFAIVLGLGYGVWAAAYRDAGPGSNVQRIFKNSAAPMATQLANKMVDLAFAIVVARLLGPDAVGEYAFAVVLIGYFSIFTDFGLGTLLTREVARDRSQAQRYIATINGLRLTLCLLSVPVLALIVWLYSSVFNLTSAGALTIAFFTLSLFPSAISATYSAVFYAFEKMEYPAFLTSIGTIMKVTFGLAALFSGFGIAGLGAVSVLVSTIMAIIFWRLLITTFFVPPWRFDPAFARSIVGVSFPLMINNFLSSVFFRIDVLLLKPMRGDAVVGYYTTAYKFIDGLNFIPSLFTLAIFPVFSRYAGSSSDALKIGFLKSLKALILISLPITIGTMLLADDIIPLFFGEAFGPSIIALQILIWFLPLSYVNSVTHYVLIALNQQRFLTVAFVIGVLFNITANFIAIPRWGLEGASAVTVISEFVLLIPFFYAIQRELNWLPPLGPFVRPALAATAMGLVVYAVGLVAPLAVQALAGAVAYPVFVIVLRALDPTDIDMVRRMVKRGEPKPAQAGAPSA